MKVLGGDISTVVPHRGNFYCPYEGGGGRGEEECIADSSEMH